MTSTAFYKGKKKSFCFGAGREDFKATQDFSTTGPGPAGYEDSSRNIGVNARKWSLNARNIYLDDTEMAKKLNIPGAGTYENKTAMPATGSYPTSEFQNSKASRMNTG